MAILGIDPGTRKCGYAIVEAIGDVPLDLGIEPTDQLAQRVRKLVASYAPTVIALGRGTHCGFVQSLITDVGIPIALVDERETTLLARKRYFIAHPPPWWLRIVPAGMLLPPRPIDDYAAVLIAERLLAERAN
jgi:RNase H-fold protein (predicted Holliday junction resolvase)